MITGKAKGNSIYRKRCTRDNPSDVAASIISLSILLNPVYVFLTIGNNAYITRAITAVALPIPEKGIKKPSMDMDGIVYKKLITIMVGLTARRYSLSKIPATNPRIMAIILESKAMPICSHNSPEKKSQFSTNK